MNTTPTPDGIAVVIEAFRKSEPFLLRGRTYVPRLGSPVEHASGHSVFPVWDMLGRAGALIVRSSDRVIPMRPPGSTTPVATLINTVDALMRASSETIPCPRTLRDLRDADEALKRQLDRAHTAFTQWAQATWRLVTELESVLRKLPPPDDDEAA